VSVEVFEESKHRWVFNQLLDYWSTYQVTPTLVVLETPLGGWPIPDDVDETTGWPIERLANRYVRNQVSDVLVETADAIIETGAQAVVSM
jgi:hypothetical protein